LAGALVAIIATTSPSSATPLPTVAPGYDLFSTTDGSSLGIALVVDHTLVTFRGVPLGSFDFGDAGVHATGATDTIVHRLTAATPEHPQVAVEVVGLMLESSNVDGYFVTLQSARLGGLPSTGTLDFTFARDGVGGLLRSELLVNYDVRYGAPDGPIVATGSTGMGFVADHVLWSDSTKSSPICVETGSGILYCTDPGTMCHYTGPPISHLHCVDPEDVRIEGVNYRLNGRNTADDFHVIGMATEQ
jgi:hypothetical protein